MSHRPCVCSVLFIYPRLPSIPIVSLTRRSLCVGRPVGCPFVSSIFVMEFDGDLLAEYLSSEIEAARLLARKFPEVTPLAHVTSLCALRMALCDPCMLDEVWADVDLFVRC